MVPLPNNQEFVVGDCYGSIEVWNWQTKKCEKSFEIKLIFPRNFLKNFENYFK
jgi:hypothetical protein